MGGGGPIGLAGKTTVLGYRGAGKISSGVIRIGDQVARLYGYAQFATDVVWARPTFPAPILTTSMARTTPAQSLSAEQQHSFLHGGSLGAVTGSRWNQGEL